MDKRARAGMFRDRLSAAMTHADANRSMLARAVGVDRSTLSQLLAAEDTRLPNAQLVAELAAFLGVSADWLLGLTDRPERPGDLVAAAVRVETATRASVDDHILAWHREARGHKIRHVPATLPDMLKTRAVLTWEYQAFMGKTPDQAMVAKLDRLDVLRSGSSDFEIAIPLHEIQSFAKGEGYYRGLPEDARREQLDVAATFCRDHYPGVRLFLFDARRLFSAPVTVFGTMLATIYVGHFYLAFRSEERVRTMIQHFDWLVRECEVDARDAADFIDGLR